MEFHDIVLSQKKSRSKNYVHGLHTFILKHMMEEQKEVKKQKKETTSENVSNRDSLLSRLSKMIVADNDLNNTKSNVKTISDIKKFIKNQRDLHSSIQVKNRDGIVITLPGGISLTWTPGPNQLCLKKKDLTKPYNEDNIQLVPRSALTSEDIVSTGADPEAAMIKHWFHLKLPELRLLPIELPGHYNAVNGLPERVEEFWRFMEEEVTYRTKQCYKPYRKPDGGQFLGITLNTLKAFYNKNFPIGVYSCNGKRRFKLPAVGKWAYYLRCLEGFCFNPSLYDVYGGIEDLNNTTASSPMEIVPWAVDTNIPPPPEIEYEDLPDFELNDHRAPVDNRRCAVHGAHCCLRGHANVWG